MVPYIQHNSTANWYSDNKTLKLTNLKLYSFKGPKYTSIFNSWKLDSHISFRANEFKNSISNAMVSLQEITKPAETKYRYNVPKIMQLTT